ncbi:hypothetical protein HDU96_009784 [Phlyctochytrium bullatum]|nr:hypothetical protein HDU96_009784 [Phlyctochytrium bullatum]
MTASAFVPLFFRRGAQLAPALPASFGPVAIAPSQIRPPTSFIHRNRPIHVACKVAEVKPQGCGVVRWPGPLPSSTPFRSLSSVSKPVHGRLPARPVESPWAAAMLSTKAGEAKEPVDPVTNTYESGGADHHMYPPVQHEPPPPKDWTEALTLKVVPFVPKALGLSGLLPFLGVTGLTLYMPEAAGLLQEVQLIYSACILSFMGAVHWGLAMANYGHSVPNISRYLVSVVPSLLAFFSVTLCTTDVALLCHSAGFLLLLGYDLQQARTGMAPAWYPGLRIVLTSIVVVSIAVTVAVGKLREQNLKRLEQE